MAEPVQLRATLNHFGHITPQRHWGMANHIHENFHELIVILNGALETEIRGTCIRGQRGDILYYPRGEWHAERSVGEEPLETLFLAWQWREGQSSVHWPLHFFDRNGRVQMLMRWLHELFPPTTPGDLYMDNVLLNAVLFEVERSTRAQETIMVVRVKTYIQQHLAESLTLEGLAAVAGLSKFHFCRQFKQATGMAPMSYLRQVRVEAARSLLLSTPWTLQAIAQQVGFADEYQLSRVFRRMTGAPPGQVRGKG